MYLVLLAAGPMLFPFVRRRQGGRRLVLRAAALTLAVGTVWTGVLVAARPLITLVLGQEAPAVGTTALLGWSMALAGVTAMVVSAGVARGVARPWPPLLFGVPALGLVATADGSPAVAEALAEAGVQVASSRAVRSSV